MNVFAGKCVFAAAALILSVAQPSNASEVERPVLLDRYMRTIAASLAQEQVAALNRIEDFDRRNLAMTYYVRAGNAIASRWSWTRSKIEQYEQSEEYRSALSAVTAVSQRFSSANPGFRLHVNTDVRSLDEQLDHWAVVRSVGRAAHEFRGAAVAQLARGVYAEIPDAASVARFHDFILAWRASSPPTLAAPGFSLHGQGRAFDFQIYDAAGKPIAVTDAVSVRPIWDAHGWTEKLSHAVRSAGGQFAGPLAAPREPWHYEFISMKKYDD